MNGERVYAKECAACHGKDGAGGASGVVLSDSGKMNLLRDEELFSLIETGAGKKVPHRFSDKLSFLDLWDVVAYETTLFIPIDEFITDATHYTAKTYSIDEHGLARIEAATGKKAANKSGANHGAAEAVRT